ncbi:MAG: hypothetical protein GXX92_01310 [Clostridiales bacterium]|nr:hypothetical protein [Clostridiales bacterium]
MTDKERGTIFDCQIGLFISRVQIVILRRSVMDQGACFPWGESKGKNPWSALAFQSK